MDSKLFKSIISFWLNIAVILTLLLCIALTVANTIYYKKLADDNGSTSISYDTSNVFYAVNLVIAIMTFLVLIMYFFKNIVVNILFGIFFVLTVTGIVAISITNTIYYKKLWDDGGSITDAVTGKTAKLLFFFNLTLSIVSLIVFLIFFINWYNLYNIVQIQERSKPRQILPRDTRGYNLVQRELTEEEYSDRMEQAALAATTPTTRRRFAPRGYSSGKKPLSPISEEASEEAMEEVNNIPNDEEETAMMSESTGPMSPIPMMSSPITMDTSIIRSPYTPSGVNTSIIKDSQSGYGLPIDISRRLDFGEPQETRTYTAINSYGEPGGEFIVTNDDYDYDDEE